MKSGTESPDAAGVTKVQLCERPEVLKRRQRLNASLSKKGYVVQGNRLLTTHSGENLDLTADLQKELDDYLVRRSGRAGTLARRLGDYGYGEFMFRHSWIDFDELRSLADSQADQQNQK